MSNRHKRASGDEQWRVFCAIEMHGAVSVAVSSHIDRLRVAFPQIRASWNRDGKFHVTLKFLGALPHSRVEGISGAALRASGGLLPFDLSVGGTGVFPRKGPPRVLWIGIDDVEGKLSELHQRLDDECAREGFAKEAREFHPHLTVARLRHSEGAEELARLHKEVGLGPVRFTVSELLVIRSELSPQGSRYTEISRHSLSDLSS
jgi:2'-5' RNA ligase